MKKEAMILREQGGMYVRVQRGGREPGNNATILYSQSNKKNLKILWQILKNLI